MSLRIGTRGSRLALWQARRVSARLSANGYECEIVVLHTSGDRQAERAYAEIGAAGIFVREIEAALLEDRIDLAVHSYKDLPAAATDGLEVAAVPERADPADCLLVRPEALARGDGPLPLVRGARVGTASTRRLALFAAERPDLDIGHLRGNVPTRVERLRQGRFDAIVLALAGIARLEFDAAERGESFDLSGIELVRLDPARFVPAPSQGALALQVRSSDPDARAAAASIDDTAARRLVTAERELLALLGGGCDAVVGTWCRALDGAEIELSGLVERGLVEGNLVDSRPAGARMDGALVRARARGEHPAALARRVHEQLLENGGRP